MANRPSTITKLPEEIQATITKLRDQGRTIHEIVTHLDKMDVTVSKSALGRHFKKQEQVTERIRKSREMAQAVARSFGDAEASKTARTNLEIMHSLIMQLMVGEDDDEGEVRLDAKDAMFVATALEKLAKASKADFETQLKAAEEIARREATEKAADVATTEARRQGLSAETVDAIKAKILGVKA